MFGMILCVATLVVIVILFVILMAMEGLNIVTLILWIICILICLSPVVVEYADTNSRVMRYARDGSLLDQSEYGLFCVQRCANVPDVITLDPKTVPTTNTISALGPLEITWTLSVRVSDWEKFTRIITTDKAPVRLYSQSGRPVGTLITNELVAFDLEVERQLHLAVGFGNTSLAELGATVAKTVQPLLDTYGLAVVGTTTTAQLR